MSDRSIGETRHARELDGTERLQKSSSPSIEHANGRLATAARHQPDEAARGFAGRFRREAELRQGESDAQTLAALGTSLIGADDPHAIYEQVIDAAVALMRSQFASMQ